MNITTEQTERIAYRLIRIEANKFDRKGNDSELGNYVRGVVDFQTKVIAEYVEKCEELKGENE